MIHPITNLFNLFKSMIKTSFKYATPIALIVMSAASLIILYVFFVVLTSSKIIEISGPIEVEPNSGPAGGIITLNYDYCKSFDASSHVEYVYVSIDGQPVLASFSTFRNLPLGCHSTSEKLVTPGMAFPGKYKIKVVNTYRTNAGPKEIIWETEPFDLTERIVNN